MKTCVIVDAYSSGRLLPAALRAHGYGCIHVQSSGALSEYFTKSFRPAEFVETFSNAGDLGALAAELKARSPSFVVAGAESGVEVADALSEALGLRTNGTKLSPARRDKYLMQETIRAAGLPAVRQSLARSTVEALEALGALGGLPLVAKPVASAATDAVFFCDDQASLRRGVEHILGKKDIFGRANTAVLLQERLVGEEYFINYVCADGFKKVTDVWRYCKRSIEGAGSIYDYEVVLSFDDPVVRALVEYGDAVLDALGIRHGPAHMEIILTSGGPVLVEVGARPIGVLQPGVVSHLCGTNQIDATACAYADPEGFKRASTRGYVLNAQGMCVQLVSEHEGIIARIEEDALYAALPTARQHFFRVKVGDRLKKTIDLSTSPGYVYLVGASLDSIRADYLKLRALERAGRLFVVA